MREDEEYERILDAIRTLSPEKRAIVLGTIAVLQAFDDSDAAKRWMERNRDAIMAQLKDIE